MASIIEMIETAIATRDEVDDLVIAAVSVLAAKWRTHLEMHGHSDQSNVVAAAILSDISEIMKIYEGRS